MMNKFYRSVERGDCDVTTFISIYPYIPDHPSKNLYRYHGNRWLQRHRCVTLKPGAL